MKQKEYEIAYGNMPTRVFSTVFHLIMEALYLFLFNIAVALLIMFINVLISIVADTYVTKCIFLVLFAALIIFDITDLIMTIFRKPQVILTDSYLYLKSSFSREYCGIHRDKVLLYSEILSCEPSWTSYYRKYGTWNQCFLLCFYDREHEVTIKTNKRILWSNVEYIIPLVNDEEFMDDLEERIELAQQMAKKQ